jgi:hypothetical protein
MSLTKKIFSILTIIWVLFWVSLVILFHEKALLLGCVPFAIGWGIYLTFRKKKDNDIPENHQFNVYATFGQAWSLIKGSKWPILAPYLMMIGIFCLTGFILGFFGALQHLESVKLNSLFSLSIFILGLIFSPVFIGSWMVAIKQVRGEKLNVRMSFYYCRRWLNILGSMLVLFLIVFVIALGIVLSIHTTLKAFPASHSSFILIPPLIIGTIFFFTVISWMMFIIPLKLDLELTLWQALIRSIKIVKPYFPEILVLFILLNLINLILFLFTRIPIAGWLIYIIAYIWFIPFFKLSFAAAYHRLLSNFQSQVN